LLVQKLRNRAGTKIEKESVSFVPASDRPGTKTERKSRKEIEFRNLKGTRFPQSGRLSESLNKDNSKINNQDYSNRQPCKKTLNLSTPGTGTTVV
jgi:hypothetical protein